MTRTRHWSAFLFGLHNAPKNRDKAFRPTLHDAQDIRVPGFLLCLPGLVTAPSDIDLRGKKKTFFSKLARTGWRQSEVQKEKGTGQTQSAMEEDDGMYAWDYAEHGDPAEVAFGPADAAAATALLEHAWAVVRHDAQLIEAGAIEHMSELRATGLGYLGCPLRDCRVRCDQADVHRALAHIQRLAAGTWFDCDIVTARAEALVAGRDAAARARASPVPIALPVRAPHARPSTWRGCPTSGRSTNSTVTSAPSMGCFGRLWRDTRARSPAIGRHDASRRRAPSSRGWRRRDPTAQKSDCRGQRSTRASQRPTPRGCAPPR